MKTFVLCLFTIGILFTANAQDKVIQLKQEPTAYSPKGYYISDVVDDRTNKGDIGTLNENGSKKIILQGGTASAIKSFIEHNVSQNKTSQPVVMHIESIEINARLSGAVYKIDYSSALSFYIGKDRVAQYNGKGGAQTEGDPADYIEGAVRKAINSDLKGFGDWWAQNKSGIVTATNVKVNVTLGRNAEKPGQIVYSVQRPLAIQDFTGPPEGQIQELAATYSGISMGYTTKTENGQLVIDLTIIPYFVKAQSWFKEEGKNAYVLAHEQAHFDITAIKACELAATIRKTTFTQDNYEHLLTQLENQNFKDASDEEATYDNETNHGIITPKQIEWQTRLSKEVRETGCY